MSNLGWDYPIFFFLALAVGVGFFVFIMRMVNPKAPTAKWECRICGAKFSGSQDKFRFCPYCGTPRKEPIGSARGGYEDEFGEDFDEFS